MGEYFHDHYIHLFDACLNPKCNLRQVDEFWCFWDFYSFKTTRGTITECSYKVLSHYVICVKCDVMFHLISAHFQVR